MSIALWIGPLEFAVALAALLAVLCPLSGCGQEHPLRSAKNKRKSQYLTCPTWGASTVWFRSPAAEEFLSANNGGRVIENPIEEPIEARSLTAQEERAARAGLVSDPLVCAQCGAVVELGAPRCPNNHELDWPSEENSGTPLQRAEGRVESDVQRLLKKIEREANET